jgi:integrase
MIQGNKPRQGWLLPVALPHGQVMAAALTVKSLQNLKPGPVRREVRDGLLPGLYFIIQPSGHRSWALRYHRPRDGKPDKFTIGHYPAIELKKAREVAREAKAKVANGIDPKDEKKSAKAAAAIPANDLIEAVAARFISQHAKRNLKAGTAQEDNRALAAFRTMCRWAVERGLIDTNPCTGIRAPSAETARDRVLSDIELKAVWRAAEALDQPYREFVQLLILTGQRRSEVAEMRWSEIDLDVKLWTLPKERAKNHRQHEIPLSASVIGILRAIPQIAGSDFVFTLYGRRPICGFHLIKERLDGLLPPDMSA